MLPRESEIVVVKPEREHRLFTRWFSRRVDLGVWLTGCLFVFIWLLLPASRVESGRPVSPQRIRIMMTQARLDHVPMYLRPDLLLRPLEHGFAPMLETPGQLPPMPSFAYSTQVQPIRSEPAGMGRLPDLTLGLNWDEESAIWYRTYTHDRLRNNHSGVHPSVLYARFSNGLGTSVLKTQPDLWQEEHGASAWEFSFWIAFDGQAGESMVFVEQSSGDAERDLRLIRIVQRPGMWERQVGQGIVWLRYRPAVGDEDANQDGRVES